MVVLLEDYDVLPKVLLKRFCLCSWVISRVSFHFPFPCLPMFCRGRTSFEINYQSRSGDGRHKAGQLGIQPELENRSVSSLQGSGTVMEERGGNRLQSLSQVPAPTPRSHTSFHVMTSI